MEQCRPLPLQSVHLVLCLLGGSSRVHGRAQRDQLAKLVGARTYLVAELVVTRERGLRRLYVPVNRVVLLLTVIEMLILFRVCFVVYHVTVI